MIAIAVLPLALMFSGRMAMLGGLGIGVGLASAMWLRGWPDYGRGDVLFVLAVVWASDIGAYLAGRFFGGPKLAPAISPGKTWSGMAGGLAAAALIGLVASAWGGGAGGAMATAGGLALLSQGGDLLESWCKRLGGVKDSGSLIPGHGGVLDRLDALLAAAPAAALLASWAGEKGYLWQ